jgi:hypothetical protein
MGGAQQAMLVLVRIDRHQPGHSLAWKAVNHAALRLQTKTIWSSAVVMSVRPGCVAGKSAD